MLRTLHILPAKVLYYQSCKQAILTILTMMHISSLLFLVTLVAAFPQRRDSLDPLLTSIGKVSDLSTFYSLFEGTGGDSGKSGPDFEERFNDPNNNLQFTALAPTNEASIYKSSLIAQTNIE